MTDAERLKQLRLEHSMSQTALGDLLGVSSTTIGVIEQGRRQVQPYMARILAEQFGVDISAWSDLGDVKRRSLPPYKTPKRRVPAKPPKLVTKRCEDCMFRLTISGRTEGCRYYELTKKHRGCPPGDECTRYMRGNLINTFPTYH